MIDKIHGEGWARLLCAGHGYPINVLLRLWYRVSGYALMWFAELFM